MQQLDNDTNYPASASDCADQLLEVTPLVMRRIREEMRRRTMPGLTVPQFRALNYIRRHPRSSLNDVAEHLGLTAPSASKLVQKLVSEKVVVRRVGDDRRRVRLSLTPSGAAAIALARADTREHVADSLKALSGKDLAGVRDALRLLGLAFSQGGNDVDLS